MGKKDKKSKVAEQKARVAAKQSKKAVQKEKKVKAKGGDDSDAEDVDLQYAIVDLRFPHLHCYTIEQTIQETQSKSDRSFDSMHPNSDSTDFYD